MRADEWKRVLREGVYDGALSQLYGDGIPAARERLCNAVDTFVDLFGDGELHLFSAPGRTEIGGNHTDHNHGRVLAGAVNLDVLAVVRENDEGVIRVHSEGYVPDCVSLNALAVQPEEAGTSAALIRGTAARFAEVGWHVGGFDAYTTSNVLKGSGLSSSAAFEVLIGTVLSHLYNGGRVSAVEIAQIAQYAENVYFGKPCGLMDQMASSVGGVIAIDFADPAAPVITQMSLDLAAEGCCLYIVDTGGNHADLTAEYAAVPAEMKAVAASLGCAVLRQTDEAAVLAALPALRQAHGDRAVLRALHFLRDNERVTKQTAALREGDFAAFCAMVTASGHSSFEYLQNVYPACDPAHQGLSLALALAQSVLDGQGAFRVHGGGFAGTTQNYVPFEKEETFRAVMETAFGEGCCHRLTLRPLGGTMIG